MANEKCSLSWCDDPYHATVTDPDGEPLRLCLYHYDQIER